MLSKSSQLFAHQHASPDERQTPRLERRNAQLLGRSACLGTRCKLDVLPNVDIGMRDVEGSSVGASAGFSCCNRVGGMHVNKIHCVATF